VILAAHQPAYLPWLGLFHKMAISDNFVVLDDVQFEKNSFINRNRIKTAQGDMWLTVPVLMTGHIQKTIHDIEINNNVDWRSKHWKSIYLNYKKSPYFNRFSDFFEDLYKGEWIKLYDLLDYTMSFFIKELKIDTKIYIQSKLNITTKKQLLILDLCKHFNAKIFVFGALGKDYADSELFETNGIKILFQDYKHPAYHQLWGGGFISNMSIIDLLFNEGERSFEILMSGNINKENLQI